MEFQNQLNTTKEDGKGDSLCALEKSRLPFELEILLSAPRASEFETEIGPRNAFASAGSP